MQEFEIAYAPDETRVVLGWPGGLLAVHEVETADGSPGAELAQVVHHKATLVCVGWLDDQHLASVSSDGVWAVSDTSSGEVLRSGSVGGSRASASISPQGGFLFVCSSDTGVGAFRVNLETGESDVGADLEDHGIYGSSRVFALDEAVAAFHFIHDGDEDKVVEGFVQVDFVAGTTTVKTFDTAPTSDFDDDTRLMWIDGARNLGVRPDYTPLEFGGPDDSVAILSVELFDARTLETKCVRIATGWPRTHCEGPLAGLVNEAPGSAAFMESQDWLVRKFKSARFAGEHLWFSIEGGAVRRIAIESEARDVPVLHGGGANTSYTLDDVFARNLHNCHTLGVSASGAYVGFGNPNDFFSVAAIGLDEPDLPQQAIRLPKRATSGVVAEAPGLVAFAGDLLVVFDKGHRMFLVDGASGEIGATVELERWYGDANDVARSPTGRYLAVAVGGGESFYWDFETSELMGLPMPPHAIRVGFFGDARAALVHHNGAVMTLDVEEMVSCARRAPDEEGEEPDEDYDAFEQRYDVYASAVFEVGGVPTVATLDEHDAVQFYSIDDALEIEVGAAHSQEGRRLVGADGWCASLDRKGRVTVRTLPSFEVTAEHTLATGADLFVGDVTGALLAFDDASGQLLALARDSSKTEVRFEYTGAATAQVRVNESLDRVAVVTAAGRIEVRVLSTGELVTVLEVRPTDEDARTLVTAGEDPEPAKKKPPAKEPARKKKTAKKKKAAKKKKPAAKKKKQ